MNDILLQRIQHAFGSCFRSVVGRVCGTGVLAAVSYQSQSGYDPSPSLDTGEIGYIVINCEVRVGDTVTLKKSRECIHVA